MAVQRLSSPLLPFPRLFNTGLTLQPFRLVPSPRTPKQMQPFSSTILISRYLVLLLADSEFGKAKTD